MKSYLDLSALPHDSIERLLARARVLKEKPLNDALRGRVIALVFMNPSLRTLASMQAGIAQLGGNSFVIQPGSGSWKLETRLGVVMDGDAVEHVREAIPVLSRYADALAVRCFASGQNIDEDLADSTIQAMADLCPKPFINLESGLSHPCQALADWRTLDDLNIPRSGGRFVLSWAYHPKPLAYAVPASALNMAVHRGMHVTILRPVGYALPAAIIQRAHELAKLSGATISETSDRSEGMRDADVMYVKSWSAPSCYGDPSEETKLRAPYRDWCVHESWFATAKKDAKVMHCLPVRRNVKISDEVLDGPRSVVIDEAENRLHVQKAVLMEMLAKDYPW
ncbi:MAG: N-acetylornithine carbamoyltransferase [Deltaproteobacteria bacterium]|nr:N-acetylornithine carbamoyltransferase [Deltaproteobacteria bacterium]